jgi:hypothetical protein
MPWRQPKHAPFTRIGIVSQIPSDSGVFALLAGDQCLMVAEAWNLKARLLDLIKSVDPEVELTVIYELCPERDGERRRDELAGEIAPEMDVVSPDVRLPGLSLRPVEISKA